MVRQTEHVQILVQNRPGVLDRVVGHIRREGWNIKSLHVDETDDSAVSQMDIYIEGTHTKLAQIVDKLIRIDFVFRAQLYRADGDIIREKPVPAPFAPPAAENEHTRIAPKRAGSLRILTVNPGSTSTKFAVYDDEDCVTEQTVRHSRSELDAPIVSQKKMRTDLLTDALARQGVTLESLDAIAGRGGLVRPIESGTYLINEAMISDLKSASASVHASALGALIAKELADRLGIPAYVVDPIVVDEMDPCARLTGMPGIERSSIFHALNQKAVARRLAAQLGRPYENLRMVVAHLGGGITVGAHRYGRVIDVNDAISGEGPFTPERTGQIPAIPLINMCFSGEYAHQELIDRVTKSGGMQGYLGTNNMREAQRMIDDGDEFAALVVDSMAYQLAKEIGAMTAALEGRVDVIVLTGGLAHSGRFTGAVKQRVDTLAPVHVYPGEDEMLALMQGALRVLRGVEQAAEYEG
jgi:butyrate kinase